MSQTHLLAIWNPSYEADALQHHLEVLLSAMRKYRAGVRDEDDVFVWWGKVRSTNRQAPLPHLADVLRVDDTINTQPGSPEVNLYLTDFRSLYVAHLGAVTADDMSGEEGSVPDYYRRLELRCDCWFQLWDIRRLVWDDTTAVVTALSKLRNTRYNDRPVSLYGGMVDLPLIVKSENESRWFDAETRSRYTGGRYWAEHDAEQSGIGEMQRDLRENHFGTVAWSALDPAARAFVASAESTFRRHRADPAFDLGSVVIALSNAVEVQGNEILRSALRGATPAVRQANVEGRTVDIAREGPFSLGQLARLIGGDRDRCDYLRAMLENGDWFVASLPPILADLADKRNPAAHGGAIKREDAVRLRDRLIGVGGLGDLLRLAQVRPR